MCAVFTEYIKKLRLLVTIGIGNIAERERQRDRGHYENVFFINLPGDKNVL